MRFRITAMITPHQGDSTTYQWELDANNHIDGITDAAKLLNEPGHKVHPKADEVLSVMVANTDEDEQATPVYWNDADRPQRDQRDPYAETERRMLEERCQEEGPIAPGTHHTRHEQYRKAHPEFPMQYLLELQRLEREKLKKCQNTTS